MDPDADAVQTAQRKPTAAKAGETDPWKARILMLYSSSAKSSSAITQPTH
jgi:hypothetical protein